MTHHYIHSTSYIVHNFSLSQELLPKIRIEIIAYTHLQIIFHSIKTFQFCTHLKKMIRFQTGYDTYFSRYNNINRIVLISIHH